MTTELTRTYTMTDLADAADRAAAAAIFERYHEQKAENTRTAQARDLAVFAAYLAELPISAPTADELYTFPAAWTGVSWGIVAGMIAHMQRAGYAASSIARTLATVKRYARLAMAAGAIDAPAAAMIATVTAPKGRAAKQVDEARRSAGVATRRSTKRAAPAKLTPTQRKALREQPDTQQGRRDALIIALLLDHGLRVSELAALQVAGVDLAANRITFYRPKVDKEQTHELTRHSRAALVAWMQQDAPAAGALLRASRKDGSLTAIGMTTTAINKRVAELGQRAGIAGRLSPHDLRHDWATRAARHGTGAFSLRDAGGWVSLEMPSRYVSAATVANENVILGDD